MENGTISTPHDMPLIDNENQDNFENFTGNSRINTSLSQSETISQGEVVMKYEKWQLENNTNRLEAFNFGTIQNMSTIKEDTLETRSIEKEGFTREDMNSIKEDTYNMEKMNSMKVDDVTSMKDERPVIQKRSLEDVMEEEEIMEETMEELSEDEQEETHFEGTSNEPILEEYFGSNEQDTENEESDRDHLPNQDEEPIGNSLPSSSLSLLPPFSLWDYLKEELSAIENNDLQQLKTERVTNFLAVPMSIERIMIFGYFICLDSFLYAFTILPIRFIKALYELGKSYIENFTLRQPTLPMKLTQKCDIIKGLLIVIASMILAQIDASQIYHNIRGQAVIKLYVIFNVLEIFDRLCCSFGQDLLDSLFSKSTLGRKQDGSRRHIRPLAFFTLALLYILLHTLVLFYQVITLNVAINSSSNALLTLLLSNQFVEIKGSVFKKFEKENLFQLTCADIVERFQLSLFLTIILIRDLIELSQASFVSIPESFFTSFILTKTMIDKGISLLMPILIVLASEILVDWLKHAFITKFNHIRPSVYGKYIDILCQDMAFGPKIFSLSSGKRPPQQYVDQSPMVARRIGFAAIPFSCLAIRFSIQIISVLMGQSGRENYMEGITTTMMTDILNHEDEKGEGMINMGNENWKRKVILGMIGMIFGVDREEYGSKMKGWEKIVFPMIVWMLVGWIAWACLVTLKLLIGINLISFAYKRHVKNVQENIDGEQEEKQQEYSSLTPREKAYNENVKTFLSDPADDILGQPRHKRLESIERFTMVRGRIW